VTAFSSKVCPAQNAHLNMGILFKPKVLVRHECVMSIGMLLLPYYAIRVETGEKSKK
jgi:hypothetical protein